MFKGFGGVIMIKQIFYRKNGELKSKRIKGFGFDVAKDLGMYSFAEIRSIARIESGAVLVRV